MHGFLVHASRHWCQCWIVNTWSGTAAGGFSGRAQDLAARARQVVVASAACMCLHVPWMFLKGQMGACGGPAWWNLQDVCLLLADCCGRGAVLAYVDGSGAAAVSQVQQHCCAVA